MTKKCFRTAAATRCQCSYCLAPNPTGDSHSRRHAGSASRRCKSHRLAPSQCRQKTQVPSQCHNRFSQVISGLTGRELALLFHGQMDISVAEWRENTRWEGAFGDVPVSAPVNQFRTELPTCLTLMVLFLFFCLVSAFLFQQQKAWFWSLVESMSQAERGLLLHFVSGCTRCVFTLPRPLHVPFSPLKAFSSLFVVLL